MKRVVVTGVGMVSPVGLNSEDSWQNTLEGRTGVREISLFDCSEIPVRIAAEVKGHDPSKLFSTKDLKKTTRVVEFAALAADEAIRMSGIDTSQPNPRWGCSIGVGMGSLADIEKNSLILDKSGHRRISPFFIPYSIPNMATGIVSMQFGLQGPSVCTATACASGTHGIGEGFGNIKLGRADIMVCGGAEATICPLGIASFNALKALSRNNDNPGEASRPFDMHRDGFVMGEGAGMMVLEELEHAKKRGAEILAEVVGYGLTGDAHHITAPSPQHAGGERCMQMALADGGINPDEVSYINAHGTSTQMNDHYETLAIKNLFGNKVLVSSTKGATGHCIGAAGGIEGVFSVMAVRKGVIPPTANLRNPDPNCDLDYVPLSAREARIEVAISNSFGFGGTNATVAFKRY